jgi:hypothetical protein
VAYSKLEKYQRYIPGLYKPQTNIYIRGLLYSWAGEDDKIFQAIKDAKEQIFVKTARLEYLDSLGSNVGVFRPTAFNLSDEMFRELIPLLSFYPKQVVPTMKKVLDIFFGEDNPRVFIHEINPNEIKIRIPSTVPALRRDLRGSHHFHVYSGTINTIDNIGKEMTITLDLPPISGDEKVLKENEWTGGLIGVKSKALYIEGNDVGNTNVAVQFSIGADLSVFTVGDHFRVVLPTYPGSFIPNPDATFSVAGQRGVLGQSLNIGSIYPSVTMTDASGIPNTVGYVILDYGKTNQEGPIRCFGRPNNTTLFLDPVYAFTKNHSPGEIINVIKSPYIKPNTNGSDYSIYLVGIEAARLLAQQIVESLVAAGVVVSWDIVGPLIEC